MKYARRHFPQDQLAALNIKPSRLTRLWCRLFGHPDLKEVYAGG